MSGSTSRTASTSSPGGEVPEWFAFDCPVTLADFDAEEGFDEDGRYGRLDPLTPVWACFRALSMGWNWALYLCHSSLAAGMVAALRTFNPSFGYDAACDQRVRDRAICPRLTPELPLLFPYAGK